MHVDTHLCQEARQLLRIRCKGLSTCEPRGGGLMPGLGAREAVEGVLDDLLSLVFEFHDRTVESLRPVIRILVLEQLYVDHAGDCRTRDLGGRSPEEYVDVVVEVLKQVREHAVAAGKWNVLLPPPLMCG